MFLCSSSVLKEQNRKSKINEKEANKNQTKTTNKQKKEIKKCNYSLNEFLQNGSPIPKSHLG